MDYGRRPYISKNVKDYMDMMWRTTSKTFWNVAAEKQSEFEKPYLEDGYNEMEHFEAPPSSPPFSMPWPGIGPQPGPEEEGAVSGECTIAMEPYLGNIWEDPVVIYPVDQCTKQYNNAWQSIYTYGDINSIGYDFIGSTQTRGEGPKLDIWLAACAASGYASLWINGYDLCGNTCWTWARPNCCIGNPDFAIDEDLSDDLVEPGGASAEIYLDQNNPGVPRYLAEIDSEKVGDENHYFFNSGLTLREIEIWEKPEIGIPLVEVWAHADACGVVGIKITDACGTEDTTYLRTTNGYWKIVSTCCLWEIKGCDPDHCAGSYYTEGMDPGYAARNVYNRYYPDGSGSKNCCGSCCTPPPYNGHAFVCDPTQDDGACGSPPQHCFCATGGFEWRCL